jgi:methionine sulfoxide reductase heme-binding subunit
MAASKTATVLAWAFWLGGTLPGLWLGWRYQTGQLGVMPHEVLLHQTGRFALLLLMATLALGFVQWLVTFRPLYAARRPLGVWTFLYACAHGAIWFWLDQAGVLEFALMEMREMVHVKLGLAALALMLPLALTSVDAAPRLIGLEQWKRLHLLVWPAAVIVIAHAWVVSRFENRLVILLTGMVLFLMATRAYAAWRAARREG